MEDFKKARLGWIANFQWSPRILPIFLCVIILSFLVVPVLSQNFSNLQGTESIISAGSWGTDQTNPSIWEDRVVWSNYYPSLEDPNIVNLNLHFYNISSGTEFTIPGNLTYQDMPDIWEDRLVYQSLEDDNFEIHLFNLSTSNDIRITNDQVNQVKPHIWGDWIVWQIGDDWESEHGIDLYNIKAGNTTGIGRSSSATSPRIWGDRVVWQEYTTGDGNVDVFYYNITLKDVVQVTTDPFAQISPSIWGDHIVWMDNREIASQVYLYDLSTGNETPLTSGDYYRLDPSISGNYVVYQNDTAISLIDLTSLNEGPISADTSGSSKGAPEIWGNRVVWSDMRNGDFDIYLYTVGVSMPLLKAYFSVNETQGNTPLTVSFEDISEGQVEGWYWDFGDGQSSDKQNPLHTYENEGSYSVILTVHNPWQRDAVRKSDLISVGSVPVSGFAQNMTSGPAPLIVHFSDQSSGEPDEWNWDFGDGVTSDEQNPEHTFTQPGIYTVNLTVKNVFGNASFGKKDLITVMDGTFHDVTLPNEGITMNQEGNNTVLILIATLAGNCTGDSFPNPSVITCVPDSGTGIAAIRFLSLAGEKFSGPENDTFSGILGGISISSNDLVPSNFSGKAGENCFFNFTLAPETYEPGGTIHSVIWEGSTPDDLQKFNDIKIMYNYGNIEDLVYTIRFDEENISAPGPAILIFGVSSDWVEQYGWRWSHEIDSEPSGAAVNVDSKFVGYTPLNIEEGLSPGNHTVTLYISGFYPKTLIISIDDKRDSIHVIRIGDDGTGEVLNTTFIGHDSEQNLDFFRAESPNGLSTFGLASLSKSGNVFQLIQMAASKVVGPSGGGGGGGGGDDGGATSTRSTTTTSTTPVSTVTATAQATALPTQVPATAYQTQPPASTQPEVTAVPGETAAQPTTGQQENSPLEFFTTGTSSIIILKNLSIIFVAIFVTIVFYYRWKGKEE
jgi:beta propeller repeat protein